MNEEQNERSKQDVHSTVVKAGKRIYYFDVKSTRNKDLYLTITESKKVTLNGETSLQKHKLFIYKEDFEKFSNAFEESITKINEFKSNVEFLENKNNLTGYSSIELEDLN